MRAFAYYGGKNSKLKFILPQLETEHAMYCELFAGSLAVLLNKRRARYEIVNDLAEDVINFWVALRDREDELHRAIMMSPAGGAEFNRCVSAPPTDDVVERARRFYVRIGGAYGAIPTITRHSFAVLFSYLANRPHLRDVAARMQDVIVENVDAVKLIERVVNAVRRPGARRIILFYADPPYTAESRKSVGGYIHDDFNHDEFLDAVLGAPDFCKFAISGYPNNLYDSRLAGWHRVEFGAQAMSRAQGNRQRTEVLWRNYDLKVDLFDS